MRRLAPDLASSRRHVRRSTPDQARVLMAASERIAVDVMFEDPVELTWTAVFRVP